MGKRMMILNVPMEIPSPDKATKGDVIQYLNEIIEYYGPPCEMCNHFSMICKKSYRPRRYEMELGPYSDWHIRKFCTASNNGCSGVDLSKMGGDFIGDISVLEMFEESADAVL